MSGTFKRVMGIIIIAMVLLSCNLSTAAEPVVPTVVEVSSPTPEHTPTDALPPTFPPPIALPTETSIPPTETSTDVPTATSTSTIEIATVTLTNTVIPFDPNSTPTPPPTIPAAYSFVTQQASFTRTPTALPPSTRSDSVVTAIQFTPMMDGDWSDWPNAESPAGYVVFGLSNWKNSADLNSSFKAAYDGNYLYIAVKIVDDVYSQISTGYNLYLGDSLEVLMDTNYDGDFYTKNLSPDDYQIGISPGKKVIEGEKEAYLYYPATIRGSLSQVLIASRSIDNGYEVEAAIPWSVFNVQPYSGMHFGFAVSVSDDDNPGKAAQDSMVSSARNRRFLNPTTWGDLILQ